MITVTMQSNITALLLVNPVPTIYFARTINELKKKGKKLQLPGLEPLQQGCTIYVEIFVVDLFLLFSFIHHARTSSITGD